MKLDSGFLISGTWIPDSSHYQDLGLPEELNSETKAQDSGVRITLFRTIGITWPTSKEISIILFCSAVLEIKAGNKT